VAAEVLLAQRVGLDRAGQEPSAERGIGHQPDAEDGPDEVYEIHHFLAHVVSGEAWPAMARRTSGGSGHGNWKVCRLIAEGVVGGCVSVAGVGVEVFR